MKKRKVTRYCAMAAVLCLLLSLLGFALAAEDPMEEAAAEPVEAAAEPAQEELMSAEASEAAYALDAAADEDEDEGNALLNFVGVYVNGDCELTVSANNAPNATAIVRWTQDDGHFAVYFLNGAFDADSLSIPYSEGEKMYITYDEDGDTIQNTQYIDGTGSIVFHDDGTVTWTNETEDFEITLELRDESADEGNALLNFVGTYVSDRCTLTVEADEAPNASIHVIWGQSAEEAVEYFMNGVFVADNMRINYSDGSKWNVVYGEDGNPESTLVYDDGFGRIIFYDGGRIEWQNETEGRKVNLEYLDDTREMITVTADFGADHADYAKMFAGLSDVLYLEGEGYQVACKVPEGTSLKEAMSFFYAYPESYEDGGMMLDSEHNGFALKPIGEYANEDALIAEQATYGDTSASKDFTIYALWLKPTDAAITVEAPSGGTTVTKKGESESDPKPAVTISGHIHALDGFTSAWVEKDAEGDWQIFEGVMEQGKKYNALIAVKADLGYYISDKGVTVNGKPVEKPEIYFWTTLLNVTELEAKAVEPTTTPTAKEYVFLNGEHGSWTAGGSDLTFRVDGDYADFTGVKVDGTLIDAKNYTSASGSTVVNLKAAYLAALSEGKHTLTVVYKDGEASTDFTVKKTSSSSSSTDNKPTPSPTPDNAKSSESTPKTGDESNIQPWALLLGASVLSLGAVLSMKRKAKARSGN